MYRAESMYADGPVIAAHVSIHEAGMASAGGFIGGPQRPPFQHPEWQGSVSSNLLDRGSGYARGKPVPHADISDGATGVARKGFGPFACDSSYRVYEESLRRTKQFPESDHHIPPYAGHSKIATDRNIPIASFGEHPKEYNWRPSRRKLTDDEFSWRVGPKTSHAGLMMHIPEPETLGKRPPFVDKSASKQLPVLFNPELERCKQKVAQKTQWKKRQAAQAEDRWERNQVLDLEAWERSHVKRRGQGMAATTSAVTLGNKSSMSDATAARRPQQSKSETSLRQTMPPRGIPYGH